MVSQHYVEEAQPHQRRLEIVFMVFVKTSFIEDIFVPTRVLFNDPAQIMSALPSVPVWLSHFS